MGSIYKRGNTYWIQYYRNGKAYQESSRSKKKMVARKLLEQREGDIAKGKIPGIHFDRITFDELVKDLQKHGGVEEAHFTPGRAHLLVIDYDRDQLSAQDVLEQVRRDHLRAELIGPI